MQRRYEAIRDTVAEVSSARDGADDEAELIEAVRAPLIALASHDDLFPQSSFPVDDGKLMTIYEIWVSAAADLALYASAAMPGKRQPPHDHTTWSCIAGVRGAERNVYFERVDDGSDPTSGVLRRTGELVITAGVANGMLGDRFHEISVEDEPALHLHLYGRPLDELTERTYFSSAAGGEPKRFMTQPDLRTPLTGDDINGALVVDADAVLGEAADPGVECSAPIVVKSADTPDAQAAARVLRRRGFLNIAVRH